MGDINTRAHWPGGQEIRDNTLALSTEETLGQVYILVPELPIT